MALPDNAPYRVSPEVSFAATSAAIGKLSQRLYELQALERPDEPSEVSGVAMAAANKVNATIEDIFGVGTADAAEFRTEASWFMPEAGPIDWSGRLSKFHQARQRSMRCVITAIERLAENAQNVKKDQPGKIVRAYNGLDLHPQIARASSDLYRNGHYAKAIEDAIIALNRLVRLRSGEEAFDGTKLMERVFGGDEPVLRFNSLKDQSDKDEQAGFKMMFIGAVMGLRNPRAHKLVKDDAERALECIAFVSLLAKLLDGAKRRKSKWPSPGVEQRFQIRRITSWRDLEVEPVLKLHTETFPLRVRDDPDEMITWVEENAKARKRGGADVDEYLIAAKSGLKVVGYLYATYYKDTRYGLINYIGVSRGTADNVRESRGAALQMFLTMSRYIRRHYPDCNGILAELDHDEAPFLRRVFRIQASHARLRGQEISIGYRQPKISAKEGSPVPMCLIFLTDETDNSDRKSHMRQEKVLEILRFIYLQVYWDIHKGDDDDCKQYREHLSQLYTDYDSSLPGKVDLRPL